jgi:alpha-beta hydrolase superfamily lysophospholipase
MGLITERDSTAGGFEAVPVSLTADGAAQDGPAVLRRRSALPTRRAVLYLHCEQDNFVPEDLVTWYTERGFHFYVTDLRSQEGLDQPARRRKRKGPKQSERFAGLDSACRHLREAEGIEMILLSAHGAGALTAAQWCDARRDDGLADALILSSPVFGRALRRGLNIACPLLVMSPADKEKKGRRPRLRRRHHAATVRLGPHVTWLRIEEGLEGTEGDAGGDRRNFFDEMGRWLGAYMYGKVRDQLL